MSINVGGKLIIKPSIVILFPNENQKHYSTTVSQVHQFRKIPILRNFQMRMRLRTGYKVIIVYKSREELCYLLLILSCNIYFRDYLVFFLFQMMTPPPLNKPNTKGQVTIAPSGVLFHCMVMQALF